VLKKIQIAEGKKSCKKNLEKILPGDVGVTGGRLWGGRVLWGEVSYLEFSATDWEGYWEEKKMRGPECCMTHRGSKRRWGLEVHQCNKHAHQWDQWGEH